jgi:Carboxypeptidase regulatory-like domain/TonB dependent receptor
MRTFVSVVAAILIAATAFAQPAGSTLVVAVTDSTGAALAGVAIAIMNRATGVERLATSSDEGTAAVPLLPAGDYVLKASFPGFRTTSVGRFHLEAGVTRTVALTLEPGGPNEVVHVTADAVSSRTAPGTVSEAFDGRLLTMTPVASRDVGEYAWQAPGAVPPAPGSRLSGEGGTPANVAGARETSNNFLLDGVDNNDLFLNRVLVTPSLDAVQEFTLLTNTYDAQYGRSAGAQVNVVVKSGGERLSGSAYEYFRDRALEARGPLDLESEPEPFRRRHQAGGTVGGPLARIESFYFLSVEGTRDRTATTRLAHVPTEAQRAGDFSDLPFPIIDPFSGAPFPGNRIPASRVDSTGGRLAALYPLPNRPQETTNFGSSPIGPRTIWQVTTRTDHQLGIGRSLFARYSFVHDDRDDPFPTPSANVPGFGTRTRDGTQNLAVGLNQSLSHRLFNELRVGWNRLARDVAPDNQGVDGYAALGMTGPTLPDVDLGFPAIDVLGVDSVGDDVSLPVVRRTNTLHVSNVLSIDRGKHLIKAGGELRHYGSDGFNHLFARGQLNFQGAYTGDAFADLLLGLPTVTILAANDNPQALRTTAVNLFAQDDWRVTGRLTLNAGLRYELNTAPVDVHNRMVLFDPATAALLPVGENGVPRAGVTTDTVNLAPRVGVAWALDSGRRLMLRAGYGVFYDSGTLIENSALYFNPPYFALTVFVPGAEPPTAANPFPESGAFVPPASVNTLAREWRTAYAQQGSLGVDGRVGGTDVTVRWVGAWGANLVRKRNLNQPLPAPGPVDERRPIPGYGDVLLVEPEAASLYHALQVRAERSAWHGLWLRAAWTWGKSIDDQSAFLASEGNDNTPQNSRAPEAERGLSDFDVRHRLVAAAIWQIPAMGQSVWGRDWLVSALFTAQTGRPFTPRVSFDNSNTGNLGGQFGYDRPNEVAAGTPGAVEYDGRAFLIAPPFTFGNAGRNILIGPAFVSLDTAVVRTVRVGARQRLEVRAEIYNVLNHTNPGLPGSFVDRPTFGTSVAAAPGRMAQLAARWMF